MAEPFINIAFPFSDDPKGKLVAMNNVSEDAVKSDIVHILLTNKGERLYQTTFGANLRKYLFEPNDGTVNPDVQREVTEAIARWMPNVRVDKVTIESGEEGQLRNEHHLLVKLDYTVLEGAFQKRDSVQIEL